MQELSVEKNLNELGSGLKFKGRFELECHDELGNLKWKDTTSNIVVDAGQNAILNTVFDYHSQVSWYVGIMATATTLVTGDTMASHAGWVEESGYTGARKAYTVVSSTGEQVTNTASKASFVFTTNATVNGAFVCASSAGVGATNWLMCEATFSAKVVSTNDTLEVTYTISAEDDGV